jgi:hypothetical protein
MKIGDPLCDCEAQSISFYLTARRVGTVKAIEDVWQVGRRDANPTVANR